MFKARNNLPVIIQKSFSVSEVRESYIYREKGNFIIYIIYSIYRPREDFVFPYLALNYGTVSVRSSRNVQTLNSLK